MKTFVDNVITILWNSLNNLEVIPIEIEKVLQNRVREIVQ